MKIIIKISLIALILILQVSIVKAEDKPFIGPSNTGITGLMEMPTARVMAEDSWHAGFNQTYPYVSYYLGISPYNGLEIDFDFIQVLNTAGFAGTSPDWTGYGDWKDKTLNFKYQILSESKYLPSLSIGANDPTGTKIFSSNYVAASKQIYPFDFTIGLGDGRYGKYMGTVSSVFITQNPFDYLKQFWQYSHLFWGVQFAPVDYLALMIEYDPILYQYQSDIGSQKFLQSPSPSKYNFGLRILPWDWAEFDLTYQRGADFGAGVAFTFDMGHPLIPIYDPHFIELEEDKNKPVKERIEKALEFSDFKDIGVFMSSDTLWIEAYNNRYYYTIRALGVIIERIAYLIPDNIQKVYIAITDNGLRKIELDTTRADIIDFQENRLTLEQFLYLSKFNTNTSFEGDKKFNRYLDYDVAPDFEPFFNDPSGFFKARLGAKASGMIFPWAGAVVVASIDGFIINTISTVNQPATMAVRSDYVYYLEKNYGLPNLMIEQLHKFDADIYGKLAFGILELEYSGIDGELAMPIIRGRFLAGINGSIVKKRDRDNIFGFKQDDFKDIYTTSFVNLRINAPEVESYIDIKYGQFLAGDIGARITISKYISGVILSAWYSFTDTSIFYDNINKGYHDTGIAVTIPFRLFKGHDSNKSFGFAVSPWLRDTAQDIEHRTPLFDYIGRDTDIYLEQDTNHMIKN